MEKNYTDKELELVFEKILKMYKSSYSPKENPKVFLLGGQPGAGKTGLENMINIKDEYISIRVMILENIIQNLKKLI